VGRKSVYPPPSTIYWLRDYFQLKEPEGVNPYTFYKYLLSQSRRYREEAERLRGELARAATREERARIMLAYREAVRSAKRWGAVSYTSVRKLFYILRRLGLIEFVRDEPPSRGGSRLRFYRIVPDRKGYFITGLQRVLWPDTYWGKRHYKWAKRLKREAPAKRWPPG